MRRRFTNHKASAVSSVVGSIFFVLILVVAIASLVTIFNSFSSYNTAVNKANTANAKVTATQLSITGATFGAFPPSTTSNFNVASGCATSSTSTTNEARLFFASGMWWEFFTCNSNFQYSTSFDGVHWESATTIPGLVAGYTVGPYFDIQMVGSSIYLAIAHVSSPRFQFAQGTLAAGGSYTAPQGTIAWADSPAEVTTTGNIDSVSGPIQLSVDASGNAWVAAVQGSAAIAVYEHQSCGSASNTGWEPNACTSSSAPTNYSPTSSPNLGALSANANMMLLPAPSGLSSTGAVLLYETGSSTVPSTGSVGVITQTALASSSWNQITLSGITDYSLTSSSALFIGDTMYLAGLESASVGATTGKLRFWSLVFTSMTAATNSGELTIETASLAWQAALTAVGSTLALFDNPSSTTIQYYTSSTLGSVWDSPAITLESGETAINGLNPAQGAFAVTWADAAPNVRFAALSSVTVVNSSPFAVHLVDAFAYSSGGNSLVAHYYQNSTEDFDYWLGQGSTTTIPLRMVWSAATQYLFTLSADNGVTAKYTTTSPPGGMTACPSGSFFSQIAPTTACASAGSSDPILISGSGANACTDTTSGTAVMMGLGLGYTTSSISSGSLFLSYAFQVTSAPNSGITTTWQLYYGTGAAPACNGATTGTALGQAYTVESQSGVRRALAQSIGVTLSGLAPSTTYWFDVQASDSSNNAWTYSNPDMGIVDVQTSEAPNLTTSTNTNACTDTSSGSTRMMGFHTTFTTGGTGFTGNIFGKLAFNVAGAATSGISTQYQVAYGTGSSPNCNAGATGTTYGNTYTVTSQAGVASSAGQRAGFVLTGLSPSTTYWVDIQATDSSGASWVYSNPTLATMEMATAGSDSLPTVQSDSNANTCTVSVGNQYRMAGFGLTYNVPSSAAGDLLLTITFQITTPGTSNVNSQWQVAWQTGAAPSCNTQGTGSTVGNTFTVYSQASTAGSFSQSETFVIQDVQKVAGTAIWVDIQAYDSSGAGWKFSQAELSAAEFSVGG